MDDAPSHPATPVPVMKLIAVPALITLAVTLLRLAGELLNWSPVLFGKAAGGGASIVGIVWLVPIFGIYFAYKLIKLGFSPTSGWRVIGSCLGAFALLAVTGVIMTPLEPGPVTGLIVFGIMSLVAAWLAAMTWPALGRTLLAYTIAARIPVAVVMLIAMFGNWGTHYDVPPPGEENAVIGTWSPFVKWLAIGFWPQFTIWIAITFILGGIFAGITALVMRRSRSTQGVPDAASVA
jgi:hypothetical protein